MFATRAPATTHAPKPTSARATMHATRMALAWEIPAMAFSVQSVSYAMPVPATKPATQMILARRPVIVLTVAARWPHVTVSCALSARGAMPACYETCSSDDPCTPPSECFDGRCAMDPCDGVQCPIGDVCYGGACYNPCVQTQDCMGAGECYENGACLDDPCDGVQCPIGDVCYEGSCYDPCGQDGDCTPPNVCYDGRCAMDDCDGVLCPIGQRCFEGACYEPCVDDGDCSPPNVCNLERCGSHPCDGGGCTPVAPLEEKDGMLTTAEPRVDFTFDAVESELVALRLETADLDGTLKLYGPDYAALADATFSSAEVGWIPFRIPQDGTYTVTIEASNAPGNYTFEYASYGLETPTESPGFEGVIASSSDSFYFFGTPGELIAADVVQPSGTQRGTASLQKLTRDGQWTGAPMTVSGHEISQTYQSYDTTLLGEGDENGIYRLHVTRVQGTGDLGIRLGTLQRPTQAGTIRVDSTGMCAGHEAGIPRLAAAALVDGATLEFCDGSHPEYGALQLAGRTGVTLSAETGASPRIVFAGTRPFGSKTLVRLENTSNLTIDGLGFETDIAVDSYLFELADGVQNVTMQGMEVVFAGSATISKAQAFFVSSVISPSDISMTDSTFVGPVDLGLLNATNVEFARNVVSPTVGLFAAGIRGDGTVFEDNTLGRAGPTPGSGGLSNSTLLFVGSDLTFSNNQIWLDGRIALNAGNGFNRTNRESNITVTGNSIVHSTEQSISSTSVLNLQDLDNVTVDSNFIDVGVTNVPLDLDEVSGTFTNNRISGLSGIMIEVTNTQNATTSRQLDLINNTVFFAGTGPGAGLDITLSGGFSAPITILNTIFVNGAATPTNQQCAIKGNFMPLLKDYNLFENWNAPPCATGGVLGANSVVGDANLAADLSLQTPSDAIDVGLMTGAPLVDFEGDARPQGGGVDIGADEF